jgi:hypothetical protein
MGKKGDVTAIFLGSLAALGAAFMLSSKPATPTTGNGGGTGQPTPANPVIIPIPTTGQETGVEPPVDQPSQPDTPTSYPLARMELTATKYSMKTDETVEIFAKAYDITNGLFERADIYLVTNGIRKFTGNAANGILTMNAQFAAGEYVIRAEDSTGNVKSESITITVTQSSAALGAEISLIGATSGYDSSDFEYTAKVSKNGSPVTGEYLHVYVDGVAANSGQSLASPTDSTGRVTFTYRFTPGTHTIEAALILPEGVIKSNPVSVNVTHYPYPRMFIYNRSDSAQVKIVNKANGSIVKVLTPGYVYYMDIIENEQYDLVALQGSRDLVKLILGTGNYYSSGANIEVGNSEVYNLWGMKINSSTYSNFSVNGTWFTGASPNPYIYANPDAEMYLGSFFGRKDGADYGTPAQVTRFQTAVVTAKRTTSRSSGNFTINFTQNGAVIASYTINNAQYYFTSSTSTNTIDIDFGNIIEIVGAFDVSTSCYCSGGFQLAGISVNQI